MYHKLLKGVDREMAAYAVRAEKNDTVNIMVISMTAR